MSKNDISESNIENETAIHQQTFKSHVTEMQMHNHHFMSNVIIGIIFHALVICLIYEYL